MPRDVQWSGLLPKMYLAMTVVFAVPESPTKRTAPRTETHESSSHVERTVSEVGTMMLENLPSGGGTYEGTSDDHGRHRRWSKSKQKSCSVGSEPGSAH